MMPMIAQAAIIATVIHILRLLEGAGVDIILYFRIYRNQNLTL